MMKNSSGFGLPVTPVTPRAKPNCAVFWDLADDSDCAMSDGVSHPPSNPRASWNNMNGRM